MTRLLKLMIKTHNELAQLGGEQGLTQRQLNTYNALENCILLELKIAGVDAIKIEIGRGYAQILPLEV